MKIGLFSLWAGSQIGGIATYDQELPPALAALTPEHEFHVYSPDSQALRALAAQRTNVIAHTLFPRSRWINVPLSFPIAVARARLDLVHTTHVPPPLLSKPYVMTFHCFSTFAHPEFYPRGLTMRMNALIRRGMRAARLILCVSHGLRDLALSEFGVAPERLAVAYNGIAPHFQPLPKAAARAQVATDYGLHAPYVLFVGVIAPRKNVVRVIEAYDLFRRRTCSEAVLALVGRRWLTDDVDACVRRLGLTQQVRFIEHVPNNQLPTLYSAAEMLVFPSLWESFGIPIIESMACATPVVTSRGSCLPEIAGGATLLVDPRDVEEIADAMCRLHDDPLLADTLREKGLLRARQFSWRACAQQTLAAYQQALTL